MILPNRAWIISLFSLWKGIPVNTDVRQQALSPQFYSWLRIQTSNGNRQRIALSCANPILHGSTSGGSEVILLQKKKKWLPGFCGARQ